MTVATMRRMMLPTARHDDTFDLLHMKTELSLADVQDVFAFGTMGQRQVVYKSNFATDPDMQVAFLAGFEQGYGLEVDILGEIVKAKLTNNVPATWLDTTLFDDDRKFIAERFYVMVGYHARHSTAGDWASRALAQAQRLLAAGSVDPAYLRGVSMLRGTIPTAVVGNFADFEVELQAYLPDGTLTAQRMLDTYAGFMTQQANNEGLQGEIDRISAMIAHVNANQERLFQQVWLPGILPADEWAAVAAVQPSMLRELYADMWHQGYAAYRAAVIARVGR